MAHVMERKQEKMFADLAKSATKIVERHEQDCTYIAPGAKVRSFSIEGNGWDETTVECVVSRCVSWNTKEVGRLS